MEYKTLLKHFIEEKQKIFNHLLKLEKRFTENSSLPKTDIPLRIEQVESYYKFFCETSQKVDEIISEYKIESFDNEDLNSKCELLYMKIKRNLYHLKEKSDQADRFKKNLRFHHPEEQEFRELYRLLNLLQNQKSSKDVSVSVKTAISVTNNGNNIKSSITPVTSALETSELKENKEAKEEQNKIPPEGHSLKLRDLSDSVKTAKSVKPSITLFTLDSEASVPKENKETKEEKTKTPPEDLPKFDIRKFSGELTDWPAFRNEYRALVHSNPNLTNSQKFTILKSLVPEKVFEPIEDIFIYRDDIGYDDAWTLLEENFSKRNNVEELLTILLQQPPQQNDSSESIVQLLETTKNCLNGLMYWNVDTKNWDMFLIHLLVGKLNEETKSEWKLLHSGHTSSRTIFDFINFLNSKLRNQRRKLKETQSRDGNGERLRCMFCQGNHPLWKCNKFVLLAIDERLSLVSDKTICRRCLEQGHTILKCWKPFSCRICKNKGHHFLLHKNSQRSNSCENLLN